MAEPDKRQFGDGSDNYSQAASDLVRAANEARNQAASAAAGASVSGGIKVGKAVAGIAKGAAAGGPWGAIASAAWSMRHTLYKLLLTWQQNIRNQLCTFEQICSIIRAWIPLRKLTTEKLRLKPFMKRGKSLYACGNPKRW